MPTLIKNGLVYDGAGNPPVKADILIVGERIAKIGGTIPAREARTVIDATGKIVMPGFIDVAARTDDYENIFASHYEEQLLRRGITTVIGGSFSESLVPFSLRHIRDGAHTHLRREGNKNWETLQELFASLAVRRPLVNFGTLIGFHTLKHYVLGATVGDPSEAEQDGILHVLRRLLRAGAFGVSFDFENSHDRLIPKKLMRGAVAASAAADAIVAISLSGLKDPSEEIADIRAIAREADARVEINNFGSVAAPWDEERCEAALARMERRMTQVHLNFDFSPFESEEIHFVSLLPHWIKGKNLKETMANVAQSAHRKRLIEHLKLVIPRTTRIGDVPPHLAFLKGKSLAEFSKTRKKTLYEGLLYVMELSHASGSVVVPRNTAMLPRFFASPLSLISSESVSYLWNEGRSPADLFRIAADIGIPPEKVIQKYTHLPAKKFGIVERGILKERYFADIVVCDASFLPIYIFVNGAGALSEGIMTGVRKGRGILKKPQR